jgi:hypothetical protein
MGVHQRLGIGIGQLHIVVGVVANGDAVTQKSACLL